VTFGLPLSVIDVTKEEKNLMTVIISEKLYTQRLQILYYELL